MEKITVSIPEMNNEKFLNEIKKLQKLSLKLNSGVVLNKLIGEEIKPIKFESRKEKVLVKFFIYEISGETPSLNGYQLVALLERQRTLNLVFHLNKEIALPEGLDERAGYCEHCNTKRARKHTFILFNEETGEYIQVGKTCVKDFTGGHKNPEQVAQWFEWINTMDKWEEADEEAFKTSYALEYYKVDDVIAISALLTDKFGYVKSWDGNDKNPSTATRTVKYPKYTTLEEVEKGGYYEIAEEVKQWIADSNKDNDYMMNLHTLVREGVVSSRKVGYIASAYHSMKNQKARVEKVKKEEVKPSEFVGEVGKRKDYSLTFKRRISYDTNFGTTFIYFFEDESGNVHTWKTTKHYSFDDNESVEMKATLKAHEEYRGTKQNVLTRCKLDKEEWNPFLTNYIQTN